MCILAYILKSIDLLKACFNNNNLACKILTKIQLHKLNTDIGVRSLDSNYDFVLTKQMQIQSTAFCFIERLLPKMLDMSISFLYLFTADGIL